MNKYLQYFRSQPEFHPPHVAEKFGVSLKEVCDQIVELWDTFENPKVVDNMIHTNYIGSDEWVFEVCDTPYKRGNYTNLANLQSHWLGNQKENQHTSVFAHDQCWLRNLIKTDSVSCRGTQVHVPWLWIEMDRKDWQKKPDLDKALRDGRRVAERINASANHKVAWAFTSGNNSSHVMVNGTLFGSPIVSQHKTDVFRRLALRFTGDIRFGNGVINPYELNRRDLEGAYYDMYPQADSFDVQTACSALENIDPNIYRVNSLIRSPWSLHEATGNPKTTLDLQDPHQLELTPHKPIFLYQYLKAWEQSSKKYKKKLDTVVESDYIVAKLYEWIEDFDPDNQNERGWSGPYFSCLYNNDSNPSVYVNTKTGQYTDFGYQPHNLSFAELEHKMRKQ